MEENMKRIFAACLIAGGCSSAQPFGPTQSAVVQVRTQTQTRALSGASIVLNHVVIGETDAAGRFTLTIQAEVPVTIAVYKAGISWEIREYSATLQAGSSETWTFYGLGQD
jgi:hypothetical protein